MANTKESVSSETMPSHHDLVDERLVRWYFWMALLFWGFPCWAGC